MYFLWFFFMQPLKNIFPQLWEIHSGLFFFHQLFQNLNFKKFPMFWCWIDQLPRSPRTVSGDMLTWFNKFSFQHAAIIKISTFLWLHCVLYFLDYLHSNGNVLPSHLRLCCNWEKDLQNPPSCTALPVRKKMRSVKTLACEQGSRGWRSFNPTPVLRQNLHWAKEEHSREKDTRAELQFLCPGWIFGITGNGSPAWSSDYEHIWCRLQAL